MLGTSTRSQRLARALTPLPISMGKVNTRLRHFTDRPCFILGVFQVLCSGTFPCDRCWRLAIPCRPQDYQTPSPAKEGGGGGGGGEGVESGRHQQRREQAAAAGAASSRPLVALAFSRASPRAHAELAAQAFMALHSSGLVGRDNVLFVMYVRLVCGGQVDRGKGGWRSLSLSLAHGEYGRAAIHLTPDRNHSDPAPKPPNNRPTKHNAQAALRSHGLALWLRSDVGHR
jgi:hypothetical protein